MKRFFEPSDLESQLRRIGWEIEERVTGDRLLTGSGRPRSGVEGA